ncbi:MAG: hypothetical protein K2U26_19010 [Cyclobacteriaceae bacterium]|nr:hypothetical protein [Cyclobacteriaceae bacterium]
MKLIKTYKLTLVPNSFLSSSCEEGTSVKKLVSLQPEEKQVVIAMSNQLNTLIRKKATLDFIRAKLGQVDKGSFMDYLSPVFNEEQKKIAGVIVTNLFDQKSSKDFRSKTEDAGFFSLSTSAKEFTMKLTDDIKNVMINSLKEGKTLDQLAIVLKSVITDFKMGVQTNTSLTFDEVRAMMAFAEFQNNSIPEILNMADSLSSNNGGRTQGWFNDLIQIAVTAIVAAAVVAVVAITGGAAAIALGATAGSWFGTVVGVGAIVGGIYGGIVGYDLAVNQNSYFTNLDPGNVGGGFLDWEHCTSNPGHWACL